MNAKQFYLKETGWEDLNSVEELDTPIEVVELLEKFHKHLKTDEMLRLINAINNSLCGLLLGDDLTEEELRNASENLLPTIQSDCARLIQEATELK